MICLRVLAMVSLLTSWTALSSAECCSDCGCNCGCRKVCRLKCEMKEVTKVEYSCECEDFCVPGKSKKVGCDCCGEPVFKPTCAVVHTKKKLVKHEVTTEVPTYKWVVESVCQQCASQAKQNLVQQTEISNDVDAVAADVNSDHKPSEKSSRKQHANASWLSSLSSTK